MVLASHMIFGTYGFWLPNDPRGSWSDFVWSWELRRFGKATTVTTSRSVAARPHDRAFRLAAKRLLRYPAVKLTGKQAAAVGRGFSSLAERLGVTVLACSILPEHVYLVLRRHRLSVERLVNLLKGEATGRMAEEAIHPLGGYSRNDGRVPSPWARGEWKVFLNHPRDVRRAIEYVENNPLKEGKPRQRWAFVRPYCEEALAERARG